MQLDTETLQEVFNALDTEHKGHITVEQFTTALEQFYSSLIPNADENPTLNRKHSLNVKNIVNVLDPEKDGIISFEDFKSAFQDYFSSKDTEKPERKNMTLKLMGRSVSINPDDYVLNQSEGENDLRTEDSGFLETGGPEPSLVSPEFSSDIAMRNEGRRAWPILRRSGGGSFHSPHEGPGSPYSGSRSDLLMDDVDSNFESIRDQMRRMEERVASMSANQLSNQDSVSPGLREQNTRLNATIAILEERLKEAESRYERDLESEKTHMESLMARAKRAYEQEVEALRSRLHKVESDLTENSIALSKAKIELENSRVSQQKASESLNDAQDKISQLQEQLQSRSSSESVELQKVIKERDQALRTLKEVNKAADLRQSSISHSSLDAVSRVAELQQIINRLKTENRDLTIKLQDAQEEMLARSYEDVKVFLTKTDNAYGIEIDKMTKEEIVDLWTQEKFGNMQLRAYLDRILEKVVTHNPELLEHA
uniref:Rab11 family-interacting protein 4A n=1 Tax=Schistocephalus solidus TaxID=70667 RepID=A0A0X3NU06_SCHSO